MILSCLPHVLFRPTDYGWCCFVCTGLSHPLEDGSLPGARSLKKTDSSPSSHQLPVAPPLPPSMLGFDWLHLVGNNSLSEFMCSGHVITRNHCFISATCFNRTCMLSKYKKSNAAERAKRIQTPGI